jgi:hypothetical protein
MTTFPVHTMESAPEGSKPALKQLQSAFGMIPNLIGAMSTSPILITTFVGLFQVTLRATSPSEIPATAR